MPGTPGASPPADRGTAFAELVAALRIPVIAAPMTGVSGFDLVDAATTAGIGGSFPTHNCSSPEELDRWLTALGGRPVVAPDGVTTRGPVIPNLIVHRSNPRLAADLDVLVHHRVPAVITSVGSPAAVLGPLHEAGILVLSDVASLRHVERATQVGVDGLVLLAAGGGGQTGWANPLAFGRAVRAHWDGPLILAGGVVDGTSLLAAQVAGFDLAYLGTPFIATVESLAGDAYKAAVVEATLDDIEVTDAYTGLPTSMIRPEATAPAPTGAADPGRGADPGGYDATVLSRTPPEGSTPSAFSAGHSAGAVDAVLPTAALVARLAEQYRAAREHTRSRLDQRT